MGDITDTFLRDQLLTRRQKLETALAAGSEDESLAQLLHEVDSALGRMEAGTYGLCEACHEPVEKGRLLADPLVRYCIDHLTESQRRALEEDLELASQLQRELLPRQHLNFGGWQVSYHYQPLGMVSGDYCDVVIHEDGSKGLYFALGDAAGKGVAASMLMAQLHAILRTLIATGLPVQALVERAGRVFRESTLPNFFATLICGRAGVEGEIEICNAGHCPALLVQAGKVSRVEATDVPLGLFSNRTYAPRRLQLAPGDTLFLYTDGLSEARSADDEEYGVGRVAEVMAQQHELAAQDLIPACLEDLKWFQRGAPLADDLTLMTIRRVA